jgi:hypothetical protein
MPITGSQKALMYALSGLARAGATRSDYFKPLGAITIGGVDFGKYVVKGTIRITDVNDSTPNTAQLIVRGSSSMIPVKGQEIIIGIGNVTRKLFAGNILNVTRLQPKGKQRFPRYQLDCVDYMWQFDWKRVEGVYYTNTDAAVIIGGLVAATAPQFTTSRVTPGLGSLDFQSNSEELLSSCVDRVMKRVGGYFKVDYDKVVHSFTAAETDNAPTSLTDTNTRFWGFQYHEDISQVRTRTKVVGGSTTTTSTVAVGATSIPVDDTRLFAAAGGTALVGANKITYTGKSVSQGAGNLTGVPASGAGSVLVSIAQGESVRVLQVYADATAASAMKTLIDPSNLIPTWDGHIEHELEDGQAGDAAALSSATGDVLLNKDPDKRVSYVTRDKNSVAGKALTINLTNPSTSQTITGSYTLQQVVISDINLTVAKFPKYEVSAGLNRKDLFDLLAKLAA